MRYAARRSTRRNHHRAGITLIEMMVAMAISLLMMAAVAQLFASVSASVSASRASIGLSESLRAAAKKLQGDLGGTTATMQPPLRPELGGGGYLEGVEGPNNDYSAYQNTLSNTAYTSAIGMDTLTGDADDILMFTIRSKDGQPFVGKFYNGSTFTTVESQMAEVVWFAVPNGQVIPITNTTVSPNTVIPVPLYTLYRRVLLIAPEYQSTANTNLTPAVFFNYYDLSARFDAAYYATNGGVRMALNSLEDLTKRESRFGHDQRIGALQAAFPFGLLLPPTQSDYSVAQGVPANLPQSPAIVSGAGIGSSQAIAPFTPASGRVGEDVVLTNVLAFDLRVYDPAVPLMPATDANGNIVGALSPSDGGYWAARTNYINAPLGYGDFVDMGYAANTNANAICKLNGYTQPSWTMSVFSGPPITMPGNNVPVPQLFSTGNYVNPVYYPTYDSWSQHYDSMMSPSWQLYPFGSGSGPSNFDPSGTNLVGSNGFDDNNNGIVDDPVSPSIPDTPGTPGSGAPASAGEQQYPAPYPVPLRGIQVKIRTYEPDSRQVREVTVTQDFLPQ